MTTYVTAVRTGRGRCRYNLVGSGAADGTSSSFDGSVADATQWATVRMNVSVFVLRDEHRLSRQEAINATTIALVLWAHITAEGAEEFNWNQTGAVCNGTTCARPPGGTTDGVIAYPDLPAGVRAFWRDIDVSESSSGIWAAFRRGDLSALTELFTSGIYDPVPMAELQAGLERVRQLASAGDAQVLAQLPGGQGASSSSSDESSSGAGWLLIAAAFVMASAKRRA